MLRIYCPQCGGSVSIRENQTLALCDRCGAAVPVPRGYSKLESSFEYAMQARFRRDYVAAQNIYTEILKQHPDSAAAYWGRALSRYGIEYQKINELDYRLVCHQAALKHFSSDDDVLKAIQLSSGEEHEHYMEESSRISALQKKVSEHSALTEPYDVVIVADENSPASLEQAKSIRTAAYSAGLRCLCPALDLLATPRQDWEPLLYHGFTTASSMVYVAVGKDSFPEHALFDANRYLSLKAQSQRTAASQIQQLILAFRDLDEYEDIPDTLFDGADIRMSIGSANFLASLCDLLAKNKKNYSSSLRQENSGNENYEYTNLIHQARLALEEKNFKHSEELFNKILNYNPRESQAYWGLLLTKYNCHNEDDLIQKGILIKEDSNYISATAFANEREGQTYRSVADASAQMHKVHQEQKAKQEADLREQDELRRQKEQEISDNLVALERKQARARLFRFGFIVLFFLIIAGGIFGYYRYTQTYGVLKAQYEEAMNCYNGGEYSIAASLFEELGDYKDSAEMRETCIVEGRYQRYYSATIQAENLETRDSAISIMEGLVDEMPEVQEYLDQWKQDGMNYLENGEYRNAYLALRGFGSGEGFIEVWRAYMNHGLVTISDKGSILAITDKSGSLMKFNCDHLNIEDGSYQSVALSDSGNSAGFVRRDGTAYVSGKISSNVDISGWTDMRVIKVTDKQVVGLKKDGTLVSARQGVLAQDVIRFAITDDSVAAVRKDGSVYCSNAAVQSVVADIADAVYVGITSQPTFNSGNVVRLYVVHEDSTMTVWKPDGAAGTDLPTGGGILAVITDSDDVGILTTGGSVYSTSYKAVDKVAYSNTFLVDFSDIMDVRIRDDMSGYGLNGMDENQIAIRKATNGLENVGLPE